MMKIDNVYPFFSQIPLSIFRWWCNSWCNEYSRKSASSNNSCMGGVFTCWQNMWLINARAWPCNHFICWTICNKHRIKIKFLLYPFNKTIIQLCLWDSWTLFLRKSSSDFLQRWHLLWRSAWYHFFSNH